MPDDGMDAGSAKGYFSFVALSPADDSIGVGLRSNLRITFDRDVVAAPSGYPIKIYNSQGLFESIDAANTMINGSEVTIDPVHEFHLSTDYYVEIPSYAFRDGSGNGNQAIYDHTVWNFTCTDNDLFADFTGDEISGSTPLTVNFTDQSQIFSAPITEWLWHFGDGDSSSVQNPTHVYEHTGPDMMTYTVSLRVRDANDSVSVMIKDDYIQVFPSNYIAGGNVSGTWTTANSPYFIGGEVIVPYGDTLIIDPGVIVKFQPNSIDYTVQEPTPDNSDFGYMTVYGTLIAQGTEEDSICFTRAGNSGWWGMIHLTKDANPDNPIEYCKMDYASYMIIESENGKEIAGLSFDGMDGTVRNSRFYNNVFGIRCDSSNAIISENTFVDQDIYDIVLGSESAPQIIDNTFLGGCRTAIVGSSIQGCAPIINHNMIASCLYGIELYNANGSSIENNTIVNCYGSGIYIAYGSVIIDSNYISGIYWGIELRNSNSAVTNNTIQNNIEHGIKCQNDSSLITGNTIKDNGMNGIRFLQSHNTATGNQILNNDSAGVYCENSPRVIISESTISGNYMGIDVHNSHVEIINDTIQLNTEHGIQCVNDTSLITGNIIKENGINGIDYYQSYSLVTGNQIIDNTENGIYCDSTKLVIITKGTISENRYGIKCVNYSQTRVDSCMISSNQINGINCTNNSNIDIINNTVTENAYHGVSCSHDSALIIGNIISENGKMGIVLDYSYAIVTGNELLNNDDRGIYCGHSDSYILSENTMSGSWGGVECHLSNPQINNNTISFNECGIWCSYLSSPQIDNNFISEGNYGVMCMHSSDPQIDNNFISDENYGVYCRYSSNPQINNNLIISTNYYGIYCRDTANPQAVNNTLVGNSVGVKCDDVNSTCTIENSILWGFPEALTVGSGITITWSCVEGGYVGEGNIDLDPMLDTAYNLTWSNFPDTLDPTKISPCIDSGNPDLNDNGSTWISDPDDRDPDGSRMDMGARYFHQSAFTLFNPDGNHNPWFWLSPVQIPDTSAPITFTIWNEANLYSDCPVFFQGGNADQFKLVSPQGTLLHDTLISLEPYQEATFDIVFKPTDYGALNSYLTAGSSPQYTDKIWVEGTGVGTGTVTGYVFTPSGEEGVQGVTVTVTKTSNPNQSFTTLTDSTGEYFLSNVGYGDFSITPSKVEGGVPHNFIPPSRSVLLQNTTPYPVLPFKDMSFFTVSGNISYLNTACPVVNRYIWMDDVIETFTDSLGNYAIEASIGTHTFRPDTANGHHFIPASYTEMILQADSGFSFEDDFTYNLSGYVAGGGVPLPDSLGGGCSIPLADSLGLIVECLNGCKSTDTIYTDALGFYSIDLAPFQYNITPLSFYYYGQPVILGTIQVDLRQKDTICDFIYHSEPVIEIKDLIRLPTNTGGLSLNSLTIIQSKLMCMNLMVPMVNSDAGLTAVKSLLLTT
nr:right-handed parallel beta-helix repeat-containing protein [Bacteroidota bacterium]